MAIHLFYLEARNSIACSDLPPLATATSTTSSTDYLEELEDYKALADGPTLHEGGVVLYRAPAAGE